VNRPPVATIVDPPTDIRVSVGDTVSFTGEAYDPDGDATTLSWRFDGAASDATGEGPIDVTFTAPGLYAVLLSARDASGLSSDFSDVRIVEVGCWTPPDITGLRVSRDRSSGIMTFTWDALSPEPEEHVLFMSPSPAAGFVETATSPSASIAMPTPAGRVLFFSVAGRNLPDCLGPY
jgi:hypothetical protein